MKKRIYHLEYEKTDEIREREENLLTQLVTLVNQRNRLVQIEDTQLQQRYVGNLSYEVGNSEGLKRLCYKFQIFISNKN